MIFCRLEVGASARLTYASATVSWDLYMFARPRFPRSVRASGSESWASVEGSALAAGDGRATIVGG